jgi:3-hydroxyisobutyrate dehydrogenase-like beta-hydroxyacid dehydrogenase
VSVTVIGTGVMGSALARALAGAGHDVTAWNRTRSRAEPLAAAGVTVADGLLDAVRDSDPVIMCVSNQAAAAELLADPALTDLLRGRTLVQMTTGTPADGRRNAAWAQPLGIGYVDAAILAYPREMGTPDAEIFYCGPAAAPASVPGLGPLLGALGTVHYLGEDAGRAAVVDAALIAFFYGTMAGLIQCVNLATAEGVPIGDLLPISGPFFSRFIANAVTETGERLTERRYGEPQSSLDTHLGGIDLLVLGASREAGIDTGVVTAIRDSLAAAVAAGHGADDIAILADLPAPRPVE